MQSRTKRRSIFYYIGVIVALYGAFFTHEYGHLTEMQKRHVAISEFSLGIGPRIVKWRWDDFTFSVRLIPIMAYVTPVKDGEKTMQNILDSRSRVAIDLAGIRNNILTGLLGIIFLYVVQGWRKKQRVAQIVTRIIFTPFRFITAAFGYLAELMSFCLIKTKLPVSFDFSDIQKSPFTWFVEINILLGLWNIMPFVPLDGGSFLIHSARNVFPDLFWIWWTRLGTPLVFAILFFGRTKMQLFKFGDK